MGRAGDAGEVQGRHDGASPHHALSTCKAVVAGGLLPVDARRPSVIS